MYEPQRNKRTAKTESSALSDLRPHAIADFPKCHEKHYQGGDVYLRQKT